MKNKLNKIIISALLLSTVGSIASNYFAILKKDNYNIGIVEPIQPPAPDFSGIAGVCNIKFLLNRGGSYGAVMARLTIDTGDGDYDWGERISSAGYLGVFENAQITASNRWSNGGQYYPAVIIRPHAGEWGVYLGNSSSAIIDVDLFNETNIKSISYADLWLSSGTRKSINSTVEFRDCSGDLLASKYILGTLSTENLVPETISLESITE